VPEVNRNKNIGEVGANMNAQIFKTFLGGMAWAEQGTDGFGNLQYLTKSRYDDHMKNLIGTADLWSGSLQDSKFEAGKVRPSRCPGRSLQ
jgi:hypothetical protein